MAVSKRVGRALWAVVVLGGLAGVLAALGWGLMTGMERAANELPAEGERRALQWAQLRGARSGRVAWQFIRDLAGELGKPLPL